MLNGLDDSEHIREVSKLRGALNAIKLISETVLQEGRLEDIEFKLNEDGETLLARFILLCEEVL